MQEVLNNLIKNKILREDEKDEHKRIYISIYAYAAIIKLSNMPNEEGVVLQTIYTGKSLKTVFEQTVDDIFRECGATIKKYPIFTGELIRSVLANSIKDMDIKIDKSDEVRGNTAPSLINQIYGTPQVGEAPKGDFKESYNYVRMRALRNVINYDKVASMGNYVMLEDKINPIYLSTIDLDMLGFAYDLKGMYYAEYPKFVSANIFKESLSYRIPPDMNNVGYNYGEHGKHEYVNGICKICEYNMDDDPNGIGMMEKAIHNSELQSFFLKYKTICPNPTEEQLVSGKINHIFKKGYCINCGYQQGELDIEFYNKYKSHDIVIEYEELTMYKSKQLSQFTLDWEYDNTLVIQLIDYIDLGMMEREPTIIWLNNLGCEQSLEKSNLNSKQCDSDNPREPILLNYIMNILQTITSIQHHQNTKDEAIKDYASKHPDLEITLLMEENMDIYELHTLLRLSNEAQSTGIKSTGNKSSSTNTPLKTQKEIRGLPTGLQSIDGYLHNYLIRILLKLPVEFSKFLLGRMRDTSKQLTKFGEVEFNKAMTNIRMGTSFSDELDQEYDNPFADIDYDGKNDYGDDPYGF